MSELNFSPNTRFLLVRTDNIGDLLLTTPSVASLKKKFPNSYITFLCRSYAAPILEKNPAISLVLKYDEYSFSELVKKIKELQVDVAIHFYIEPKSVLATFRAGIPVRIGPFSKLCSLLLNHRIKQNRSQVEKHEAEYNFDLVKVCGAEFSLKSPEIFLSEEEKRRGKELIVNIQNGSDEPPVIIHPGSKGSAQSWPLENFIKLSQLIGDSGKKVIFTFGKGEEMLVEKIKTLLNSGVASSSNIQIVPAGSLTLRELASMISQSKLLISNSTGPLHMAVSLNRATLSFYPRLPIVTSAKRWGPYSPEKIHTVLFPEKQNAPMSSISVETAYQSFKKILQQISTK